MARPAELAAPGGPFHAPDPATRRGAVPTPGILAVGATGTDLDDLAPILAGQPQEA